MAAKKIIYPIYQEVFSEELYNGFTLADLKIKIKDTLAVSNPNNIKVEDLKDEDIYVDIITRVDYGYYDEVSAHYEFEVSVIKKK